MIENILSATVCQEHFTSMIMAHIKGEELVFTATCLFLVSEALWSLKIKVVVALRTYNKYSGTLLLIVSIQISSW